MIDVWELLKATDPDESGYFDDAIHRALELECSLPTGSIAWVHSRWPGIEIYLYEDRTQGRRELLDALGKVLVFRRPSDHGQDMEVDWVVHITERGT